MPMKQSSALSVHNGSVITATTETTPQTTVIDPPSRNTYTEQRIQDFILDAGPSPFQGRTNASARYKIGKEIKLFDEVFYKK